MGRMLLAALAASLVSVRAQQAQTPVFTSGTTIVPVDVRALDDKGQPVVNLTQADFTVFENGVPQRITAFAARQMTADSGLDKTRIGARDPSGELAPANRRVFLIVVGRGRLEAISHGLQAASDFLRHEILPQDLVAVMGWDRATDFSTDHEEAAALIDRLKPEHEKIEAELTDWFGGLRGVYGPKEIPPKIQAHIDRVFEETGEASRPVGTPAMPNTDRIDRDRADAIAAIQSQTPVPNASLLTGGQSLEQYTATMTKADQDLSKLYAGIEYLRGLEGEKHLVFITQSGVGLPRVEDDKDLATRAADARVAIDCIQTGGTTATAAVEPYDAALFGSVSAFDVASLERLSEITGGTVSIYSQAAKGFTALERATSFQYLIGYTPARSIPDDTFRRIDVKVRRPGVTLEFRHGYFSTPLTALSERQVLAYSRILDAARHPSRADFKISSSAIDVTGPPRAVDVKVTLDPSKLKLTLDGGKYVGSLDVAVFCSGQQEATSWHQLDIAVPEDQFTKAKSLSFTVRSLIDLVPRSVLVVVYGGGADVVAASYARER